MGGAEPGAFEAKVTGWPQPAGRAWQARVGTSRPALGIGVRPPGPPSREAEVKVAGLEVGLSNPAPDPRTPADLSGLLWSLAWRGRATSAGRPTSKGAQVPKPRLDGKGGLRGRGHRSSYSRRRGLSSEPAAPRPTPGRRPLRFPLSCALQRSPPAHGEVSGEMRPGRAGGGGEDPQGRRASEPRISCARGTDGMGEGVGRVNAGEGEGRTGPSPHPQASPARPPWLPPAPAPDAGCAPAGAAPGGYERPRGALPGRWPFLEHQARSAA